MMNNKIFHSTSEARYNKNADKQPYKYNGKELDRTHGLDWYDYGARNYDAIVPQFTSIDPLCEKYYNISPYAYCGNNPINAVDPDGRYFIFSKECTPELKKAFYESIANLKSVGCGDLYDKLNNNSTKHVYVHMSMPGSGSSKSYNYKNNSDLYMDFSVYYKVGNVIMSPSVVLNHELDHILDNFENYKEHVTRQHENDKEYGNKEERKVITGSEQITAFALGEIQEGEITRDNHEGGNYYHHKMLNRVHLENMKRL